jgi:hypothetical protein
VDRRWGRSSRGPRRFTRAAWRGLGWPEGLVPTATRDGGEREIDGEVVLVLKGGDGGAGELHGNKAKLLEGLVWIEKRRGELSTAARSDGNGVHGGGSAESRKIRRERMGGRKRGPQQLDSGLNRRRSTAGACHGTAVDCKQLLAARPAAERHGQCGRG